MSFRECYFEYAGQSSQPYNLMLCYVGSAPDTFDSGGKFDLQTDSLLRSHETLLYGKDYSGDPLEFEVELLNLHGAIPLTQMIEIKNWLFGQDGWKTFKCLDDRQDYRLKCLIEPGEDIVDGTGYRGLRCTLKNASPFWYGEPIEVTTNWDLKTIDQIPHIGNIPQPDGQNDRLWQTVRIEMPPNCVDSQIFPDLQIKVQYAVDKSQDPDEWWYAVYQLAGNPDWQSNPVWQSGIEYSNKYLIQSDYDHDNVDVKSKYGIVYSHITDQYLNVRPNYPVPLLRLHPGVNNILIHNPSVVKIGTKFICTPMFRLGAF